MVTYPAVMSPSSKDTLTMGAYDQIRAELLRGSLRPGAPLIDFRQDASRYFDWHHSSEDTLDKIDPAQLNQNVAAWAAFLTIVGDSDVSFRPPSPAKP